MRFTKEKQLIEDYWEDTKKTKTKFLWWPMTIDGETRWLETAEILYKVKWHEDWIGNRYYDWTPIEFLNK